MTASGQQPEPAPRRVFKTPIIVPLSVVMVIGIYGGYSYYFFTGEDQGLLAVLRSISFEVFLLSEVGIVTLATYNKRLLDAFLRDCPVIENGSHLERLKPIARTNMYSALVMMVLLGVGSLTAIMSILNFGGWKAALVAALSVATAKLFKWYGASEKSVQQIECSSELLEPSLDKMLQCWMHKPFPDF